MNNKSELVRSTEITELLIAAGRLPATSKLIALAKQMNNEIAKRGLEDLILDKHQKVKAAWQLILRFRGLGKVVKDETIASIAKGKPQIRKFNPVLPEGDLLRQDVELLLRAIIGDDTFEEFQAIEV